MARIGFVALGAMGTPIATNVPQSGYQLAVWDFRLQPCEPLEQAVCRTVCGDRLLFCKFT